MTCEIFEEVGGGERAIMVADCATIIEVVSERVGLFTAGEKVMSIHFVIEMPREQTAQSVMRALDLYKARLRNSVERTRRRLAEFEMRYQVTTAHFLKKNDR